MKLFGTRNKIMLLVIGGCLLGACSSSHPVIQIPNQPTIQYNKTGSSIVISQNGNSMSSSEGIPSNFPKDVPLPDGAKVLGNLSGSNSSAAYFDIFFAVPGPVSTAANSYYNLLKSKGFTCQPPQGGPSTMEIAGKSTVWSVSGTFVVPSGPVSGYTFTSNQVQLTLIVEKL